MPPKSKKDNHPNPKPKSQQNPQSQTKPNWPPLRPLIPSTDLYMEPLLVDQIYTIRNFFSSTLCKNYVSFLSSLPLVTTPGKPKKGEAVRVNDRFQIEDATFAETLWSSTALKELVSNAAENDSFFSNDIIQRSMEEIWGGDPLGLNANIRIYRYSEGQFFAQHYDDSNTLTFSSPTQIHPKPARTTWTLLIYLSSCIGGETVFYPMPTRTNSNPEPISVAPEVGMALLHRHGEKCLLHEGKEVTGGEKWVLRSDLVVAR